MELKSIGTVKMFNWNTFDKRGRTKKSKNTSIKQFLQYSRWFCLEPGEIFYTW